MPGINFYEFVILIVLALVLLGPERLPQYAQTLTRWVRRARSAAEDAKVRFKEETGADLNEVDWQKYDPRQYDPRRIIREALAEDYEQVRSDARTIRDSVHPRELFGASSGSSQTGALAAGVAGSAATTTALAEDSGDAPEQSAPAPFDPDAT